ncbi:ester cyclase [Chromobacterium amazonense]|uniref:Ester cyclase n=1 Tax=Chromobacterium amazonense TaxID=1382803 RepID=A0A1S1XAZ6_9NEIS|nr:ester cyclase [Chromobacterium amazonense]KIA82165.1 polyketide cyclase [Chromobacterium piscinae]MBM2883030.1 ester cyclase [Chromobacterium amazonense]MDE1712911.1 ester cyclase [Chromobacterium amazonense]MDQ4540285.1 ester cyclase [Chromobacterium amazonense]OHX17095.1 polyketide cyclase [Chromobacterium amazonense]
MSSEQTRAVVQGFLTEVRSGRNPDAAALYMASSVAAHQLESENPRTLARSPANYAEHVREFLRLFGDFELRIDELLVNGDRAYARWTQFGHHQAEINGVPASGEPLALIDSACYRVADGKIVEYWIQADRMGLARQLE